MTTIRSAKLATQTVRSKIVMARVGASNGRVMERNCLNTLAPSIDAASYKSLGIDCSAARLVMAKNGMPHQMEATIGPIRAVPGAASKLFVSGVIFRANNHS